jgi:cytochrome oxidase Cu insertion factor (SCO1/SenC/PrrC family)
MIKYSKDVESTVDKLLNTHGFLSSLDYYGLSEFMNEVFNKISMPDLPFKIVSHKEETSEWFWKSFWVLFDFTDRPSDLLLQMGVENAQDFLSSIPDKKLTELIDYSDDSEELIAVLKKFGRI